MKRQIRIFLDDIHMPIGELRYDRQGRRERAAFAYSSSWLTDKQRFTIEPALQLVSGFQFPTQVDHGSIFHGAIADTEPDGWGRRVILRAHAKRRRSAAELTTKESCVLGEIDFLLAVDDESRMGALRFQDESGQFQGGSETGDRRTPPLLELEHLIRATRAVEMSVETEQDLAYLQGRGTSLGGLRPKCSIRDSDGHLAIAKFPSAGDERVVTKGEILALHLAARAGINAADGRLVYSDDQPVALIRRFDRRANGTRIPYMSAATLLGADRRDQEQHAYTEIVDALRMYGSHTQLDIEELYRRIAFSILINNVDDHLHNHGVLHVSHGLWRLTPAFDINPFPDRYRELKTWISAKTGPEASLDALRSEAPYFRIKQNHGDAILRNVIQAVSRWREVGRQIGMSPNELDTFEPAFDTQTTIL
jgi:serine/threonine-protein kinase HipA